MDPSLIDSLKASFHTQQTSSTTMTDSSHDSSSSSSTDSSSLAIVKNEKSPLITSASNKPMRREELDLTTTTTTKDSHYETNSNITKDSNPTTTTAEASSRHDLFHLQQCVQSSSFRASNNDNNDEDDSMSDDVSIDLSKLTDNDRSSGHFSAIIFKGLADFLAVSTGPPQLVMWGFLTWYLTTIILCRSFLTTYKPFLDAIVIMLLIGFVLNANAFVAFKHATLSSPMNKTDPTLGMYLQSQPFSVARLFAIPYCVSCYSGVANSAPPGTFVSVLPQRREILIPVVVASIAIPFMLWQLGVLLNHWVYPKEAPSHFQERRHSSMVINV